MFKYSARGVKEFTSWKSAAWDGNTTPPYARRGVRRVFNVDAYLGDEDLVSGIWLSQMDEPLRKMVLKELRLPVRKTLVYRQASGAIEHVVDLMIKEVWNGWCGLSVKTEESGILPLPVHSHFFSEMNASQQR